MATNFFKVKVGENLQPQAGSVVTVQGDVAYNQATNALEVFTTAVETIATTSNTAVISNKELVDNSVEFVNSADPTKQLNFILTGSSTGTTLTLAPAQTSSEYLFIPNVLGGDSLVTDNTAATLINKTLTAPVIATIVNTGTLTLPTSTDTLVGRATTDTLSNKSLVDTSVAIVDSVDPTKQLAFNTSGSSTATTLTLSVSQGFSESLAIPNVGAADTIVTNATAATLTLKTIGDGLIFNQVPTPSNPPSGFDTIYTKNDDHLYILNSSGVETQVGSTQTFASVAMTAVLTSNQTPGADSPLIFDTVQIDTNNAYNHTTGIYTVPYTGIYTVTVNNFVSSSENNFLLWKNGAWFNEIVVSGTDASGGGPGGSLQLSCTVGDTLQVVSAQGTSTIQSSPGTLLPTFDIRSVVTTPPATSGVLYTSSPVTTVSSSVTSSTFTTFDNSPALTFTPSVTGTYKVYASVCLANQNAGALSSGRIFNTSGGGVLLSESDGTIYTASVSAGEIISVFIQSTYTLTAGTSYVFDIQGQTAGTLNLDGSRGNGFCVYAEAIPGASTSGVNFAPTQTIYTSGSGTYSSPIGALYLEVEMVGGGAGGNGSGEGSSGGISGSGTGSLFGTSLLTAAGGGGNGGSGGTATINSPAIGLALMGTSGSSGNYSYQVGAGGTNYATGLAGASSPFGGAGGAGGVNSAGNGIANTGAGGGSGAVTGANATALIGSSGSAGGYIKAIISTVSSTYSYNVGTGGSFGTAGTNGGAGGNGGSGIIIITEYYQ